MEYVTPQQVRLGPVCGWVPERGPIIYKFYIFGGADNSFQPAIELWDFAVVLITPANWRETEHDIIHIIRLAVVTCTLIRFTLSWNEYQVDMHDSVKKCRMSHRSRVVWRMDLCGKWNLSHAYAPCPNMVSPKSLSYNIFTQTVALSAFCNWSWGDVNSAKKEKALFLDPVFQRDFVKIQIASQIFVVKGLNTVSHACSMNHKQLMNMHLWNGR